MEDHVNMRPSSQEQIKSEQRGADFGASEDLNWPLPNLLIIRYQEFIFGIIPENFESEWLKFIESEIRQI